VYGRRYYVRSSASGYRKRGVASWYGEKFHGRRTSSGEPYDMYAMTAAHKTLPLPAYVRVTSLENGRSVVVRVNDRGPFIDNRLIDLSYAAATKLGMIGSGTAMVQVEVIDPAAPAAASRVTVAPPVPDDSVYVQAGAFRSRQNADALAGRIRREAPGVPAVFVVEDEVAGRPIYRVRIGPIAGVEDFDRVVQKMTMIGIPDAYLALD
jgi:rare lipoprotein A